MAGKRRLSPSPDQLHQVIKKDRRQRESPDHNRHQPCQYRPDIGEQLHGHIMGDGTDRIYGEFALSDP